ncbi:hypothetical protein Caci_1042 [Catenulispora acidiphila DSM 44928]|uniref:Uncharacterized protein n=1 Tax=Catenulispora acidiphila (strain DSM 44928 / JCM 14897 / NBRC 102108 / NRRL B-24433 / ID139908) TaxID=479433 RepID=C7Q4A8_CATAD|nr:hypothetical protein [Catenulispora acidiphila]ACU69968.1 hypothetical protein Caci_1042 [Catenulispora acidiphila DSM 44928]
MGSRGVSHIELSSVPVAALIISAAVGCLAVAVVVLRVVPTWQRAQIVRNNLAPGVGLLAVIAFFSRKMLWYEAVVLLPMALAVLLMGKLPEDLPRSTDPAIREHPQYPAIRRRGIAASVAVMVVIFGGAILTAVFVR